MHLRSMHFAIYKLYLNLQNNLKKRTPGRKLEKESNKRAKGDTIYSNAYNLNSLKRMVLHLKK